ncbi:hypothetical protein CWI42_050610 [Ordospora colligata]|uniref:Uncharacterized protein n=1 Tax=Ordospora colligata OC4 TaxID=1354746 RepID=A0A0B2UKV5_9MICR|nr:uncharacterized protein M896_050640 [Ordospora colligata OC4]KHN69657.1 hypothetical protein M896_050640 [Ordospora colligata OC4]TBU15776.1 hypothetical protein CWI41_050630 [Ordospora colligata]TBU15904.1 hypothetical protein CWI40_050650 [Ordospora colligata]TBU18798.1 hypothetical protein CWI42_050610 [Ordospora colligata]
MPISEKILLKILEHKNSNMDKVFNLMCTLLGLQYFFEGTEQRVYTLASPSFIIDVSESAVKLTFVEERFSECFRYVEFYLGKFLANKNLVNFYYYLKMFAKMETGYDELLDGKCTDTCRCVYDGKYCANVPFSKIVQLSGAAVYNIYRHRLERHLYAGGTIIAIPEHSNENDVALMAVKCDNGNCVDVVMNLNLAVHINSEALCRKTFECISSTDVYWKGLCKGNDVTVRSDLSVYVNGCIRREIAFLMKLGKSLEFSLCFFDGLCC